MSVLLAGVSPALKCAAQELIQYNIPVTYSPNWQTEDVLLDVPTFRSGGMTPEKLDTLLSSLPQQVHLWGGKLDVVDYRCTDLLKDESYLWENAAITARCAIKLADRDLKDCPVLILGWGRIGTHLAKILQEKGSAVTVAVRNPEHLNRLSALGYQAVAYSSLSALSAECCAVFNTVPFPVAQADDFPISCLKMDLASQRGITGENVIWARGLPGIHAPEESGKLIAKTYLRMRKELTP